MSRSSNPCHHDTSHTASETQHSDGADMALSLLEAELESESGLSQRRTLREVIHDLARQAEAELGFASSAAGVGMDGRRYAMLQALVRYDGWPGELIRVRLATFRAGKSTRQAEGTDRGVPDGGKDGNAGKEDENGAEGCGSAVAK